MSRMNSKDGRTRHLHTEERTRRYSREGYVDGSAAPKLAPRVRREEKKRNGIKRAVRKNREKASYMNFGYVGFTLLALAAACVVLIGYVRLQSDVTNKITNIAKLESELNSLKLSNDEEYNRIMSSVDLEEIKQIAIEDLGMKYAKDGQIITYSGEGSDYVRQYNDIPK